MFGLDSLNYFEQGKFFLIAGPCAVESAKQVDQIASELVEISDHFELPLVFKASYKKANRSKLDSFTGIGDSLALSILDDIRKKYKIPVTTDIHDPSEASVASYSVDMLQIPAFLCRQTDLLIAAAKTGIPVNVKKGQFMSAESMKFAVDKIKLSGNQNVFLTERGTTFGYQDLVVDFRSIPKMKEIGCPVIMDCTHSLQKPNQSSGITGGDPDLIETMAKAAIAVGADGLFIETHYDPSVAKSDGANMLSLSLLKGLIERLIPIKKAINHRS